MPLTLVLANDEIPRDIIVSTNVRIHATKCRKAQQLWGRHLDTTLILQFVAPLLGIAAAVVAGLYAARVAKLEHKLGTARAEAAESLRKQEAERSYFLNVVNLAQEPLLYAASDLQSRLYKILETDFVNTYAGSDEQRHQSNINEYTAFLFAQYFGWAEAIREGVLLSEVARRGPAEGEVTNTTSIAGVIREINDRLSDDSDGWDFMIFSSEQHAIGERMLTWEQVNGVRVPRVMRYAAFTDSYRNDPTFSAWFKSIHHGMAITTRHSVRHRLTHVQRYLVRLMNVLDPATRIYKTRTKLTFKAISPVGTS